MLVPLQSLDSRYTPESNSTANLISRKSFILGLDVISLLTGKIVLRAIGAY